MAKILVVDNQKWVTDLCSDGLEADWHTVRVVDDPASVQQYIARFQPDVVLLNLYLQHGFMAWDVLTRIKATAPDLPVIMVSAHAKHLFCSRLSQADGYLYSGPGAARALRERIAALLTRPAA
jgi:DNA-binding response OmpR family regulator